MKKIKELTRKNWLLIMGLIGLIIFWVIVEHLYNNEINNFDNYIYGYVRNLIGPKMTIFFKVITEIGNVYVIASICLIYYLYGKDRKFAKANVLNAILAFGVNYFLKNCFDRPRPLNINLVVEDGFSFPSGHSMESASFYGFIAYNIYKSNRISKKNKILSIIGLVILVLMIGLSRIYLGVHYASDVIAGFSVSMMYLALYISFYKRK